MPLEPISPSRSWSQANDLARRLLLEARIKGSKYLPSLTPVLHPQLIVLCRVLRLQSMLEPLIFVDLARWNVCCSHCCSFLWFAQWAWLNKT